MTFDSTKKSNAFNKSAAPAPKTVQAASAMTSRYFPTAEMEKPYKDILNKGFHGLLQSALPPEHKASAAAKPKAFGR